MNDDAASLERAVERIRENPFYVLGVRPDASRQVVDREGQKLLGMLELGLQSARTYPTPVGPSERTPEKVRAAMAELHRPERRLVHELWARVAPPRAPADAASPAADPELPRADAPYADAFEALGWRRR